MGWGGGVGCHPILAEGIKILVSAMLPDPYCETPKRRLAWMSGYSLQPREPCFAE